MASPWFIIASHWSKIAKDLWIAAIFYFREVGNATSALEIYRNYIL